TTRPRCSPGRGADERGRAPPRLQRFTQATEGVVAVNRRQHERVLFISSNGTGLGHLTRSMAIARRLDAELEPLFVSLSAAAPVVEQQGFEVEYVASHATPTAGSDWRWS